MRQLDPCSILTTLLITLASISLAILKGSVPTVTKYRHLTGEETTTTMPSVVSSADSLQTRLQPSTASAYLNRLIITTLQRRGVDAAEAGVIAEMERLLEHREWNWPLRNSAASFNSPWTENQAEDKDFRCADPLRDKSRLCLIGGKTQAQCLGRASSSEGIVTFSQEVETGVEAEAKR